MSSTSSDNSAQYISTRGNTSPMSFSDAVMTGLAPDGGLLIPAVTPDFSNALDELRELDYCSLAKKIMHPFVGSDMSEKQLAHIIQVSYASFSAPGITPVTPAGPLHILELFHGPTLAFKDLALQFLGNCFEHILEKRGHELNLLCATSGDTGSAAIYGVRGRTNINIFVMHPHQKVSPVQECQMTTVLDENVRNIAIEGTFDDTQKILKDVFNDLEFKNEHHMGAVNSVNWARILAQIVYYFFGAFRVQENTGAESVKICVPTGNFGNVFAGYLAKQMGAPIKNLVLATNENDILSRFFQSGIYKRGEVHPTYSPSMDIQVASNFERYLFYRLGGDAEKIRNYMTEFAQNGEIEIEGTDPNFETDSASTSETLACVKRYHESFDYLPDPHTAAGISVAERFLEDDAPTLSLATAHPAKFPDAIRQAVGRDIARHPKIDGLSRLPAHFHTLEADSEKVKQFIKETLAQKKASA